MYKLIQTPPFDIMNMQEPYSFYHWARKNDPIFYDENSGYWLISRYHDVKEVLRNEASFSAELERVNYSDLSQEARKTLCPINFVKLYGLSTTENPDHDRVKKVASPIFNQLLRNHIEPQIRSVVRKELEVLKEKKEFNIVKELFYNLPAQIIFLMLGIPEKDVSKIKNWSESRLTLTWGTKEDQVKHAENIVRYWRYTESLVKSRLKEPKDDLPSLLLKAYFKGELTLNDINLLCYGLIFSGHTTTTTFLTESLKAMLESGLWNEVISKGIPFQQTTEELLRYCPSAFTRRRIAKENVTIGGKTIPKDGKILLVLGSANRDETKFPEPDTIDIFRQNAKHHLSLGNGFHYCIGSLLVKKEYTIVMEELANYFPSLSLSPRNNFQYDRNISIRFIKDLWFNRD